VLPPGVAPVCSPRRKIHRPSDAAPDEINSDTHQSVTADAQRGFVASNVPETRELEGSK
jgi:hypothetical protein